MDALGLEALLDDAAMCGQNLRAARATVAVAESCTGGLLGAALTAAAGASDYVRGGVIAYADDVKVAQLGVDAAVLREHGAVSEAVAGAMAAGVRERFRADVGLAITGVAGPGASERKPAGLIYVALADGGEPAVIRLEGDHGRSENRVRAVRAALRLCSQRLGAVIPAAHGGT